jgi:hypothetical protein
MQYWTLFQNVQAERKERGKKKEEKKNTFAITRSGGKNNSRTWSPL